LTPWPDCARLWCCCRIGIWSVSCPVYYGSDAICRDRRFLQFQAVPPAGLHGRQPPGRKAMKADIHPNYQDIKVICSCGNSFTTRSTLGQELHVEVCSACHPFYTGKQKILDTGGRVDKFRRRYGR